VRAYLALDELEGPGAYHLLPIEFLAAGIPARLALHHQIGVSADHLNKLRHRLLEVEHDFVVVNDLHTLVSFLGHLFYGVSLRHPHHGPPDTRITLHRLRLGDKEDRVAHVPGGKLAPMLVEFDALA
jgi:hypothetical protein